MTARTHRRRRPRTRRALVAVGAVLGLTVAGCGDDDEPPSGSATSPDTDADAGTTEGPAGGDTTDVAATTQAGAAATGTPIRIGQIATVDSPNAASSTIARDVLDAWVQRRNATGGVAGHPVEFVSRDDKADPGQGQSAARELIESENVVALVGNSAVYTEAAWADLVTEHAVPVVGGVAYSQLWVTNPLFYPVGPDQTALLYGEMYVAKELVGAEKVGLLLCDTANVCDASIPAFEKFATDVGVELSALVRGGNAAPDYAAQCLAIQQSGAEVMIVAGPPVRQVADDCVRQGYEPTFMVIDAVGLTASTAAETESLDGAYGSLSAFPVYEEFPETKPFFDAMREYHPEYFDDEDKYDQLTSSVFAPIVWSSAEAFAKAVENSGVDATAEVTREDIVAGLAQFSGETLGGITPELTYGDGSESNPRVKCFFVMAIADGALVAPEGLTTACEP